TSAGIIQFLMLFLQKKEKARRNSVLFIGFLSFLNSHTFRMPFNIYATALLPLSAQYCQSK
ncbi:hypothetical protein, partial [Paenibacillus riograndensis]|uniref:hypothetical protein n=1 Tax=Paenibacillus riograndensis TaxID=483937 RepID=UPI001B7FC310